MGSYGEVDVEGGGVSIRLGKVLSRIGTCGVDILGGYLGAVGSNGEEY